MINDDINHYLGVFSYPFVSLEFLHEDILDICLQKSNDVLCEYNSDTNLKESIFSVEGKSKLREQTINYIRNKYNVYSYDEIYLLLDKWYLYPKLDFNNKIKKYNSFDIIFEHLKDFSTSLISQRDGKIVYKYWENEKDKDILGGFRGTNKIYLFHSLSRLFPLDILNVLYLLNNNKDIFEFEGNYGNIEVSDILLESILENGVAENHLHKGVSGSFLAMWDDFMKPVTLHNLKMFMNLKLNNIYKIKNDEIHYYLWLAGIIRARIALIIKQNYGIKDKDLESLSSETNLGKAMNLAGLIKNKKIKNMYSNLVSQYSNYSLTDWVIDSWDDILKQNIQNNEISFIKSCFNVSENLHTSDENIFLFEALNFIITNNNDSKKIKIIKIIKVLFLNYLRIKNFFYSLVVQPKTIHGLNHFQDLFYDNNSDANKAAFVKDSSDYWERVIREQLQNFNLKKLELKMSLSNKESENIHNILNFLKAYRKILYTDYCKLESGICQKETYVPIKEFPRIGLVIHLIKQEQDYFPEKCNKKSYNSIEYAQYGKLYLDYIKQIEMLKCFRKKYDGLDRYLVGLDVASLENVVPTWVFTSIYEKARDSKTEPLINNLHKPKQLQSLSFTMHAGEDFRHILSGLRRIYEAVKNLKFHAGDRIGHGIALGISPQKWFESNSTIIIPHMEALENYIWSYDLLVNAKDINQSVRISYIEKRIYDLASYIFGEKSLFTIKLLVEFYNLIYSTNNIYNYFNKIHNRDKKNNNCLIKNYQTAEYDDIINEQYLSIWTMDKLIMSMHCQYYVHKMNEPIHMKITQEDIDIAIQVQKIVQRFINERGIIVEVNPTSNVAIADIDTLSQNQIYSINKCRFDFENILTCINSDDSSVFNTNVSNELGYIYFGMIEKGESRENILQWIEKLRNTGMKASFIRRKDSDMQILDNLNYLINNI